MQGPAPGVNVASIRRGSHGNDIGSQRTEQFGAKPVGGAIGAVEHNSQAGELGSRNDAAAKEGVCPRRGCGGKLNDPESG